MAVDKLHIICGNCGHDATDENFSWSYRSTIDYGGGEFDPADVYISCRNCGTLHALGKYMQRRRGDNGLTECENCGKTYRKKKKVQRFCSIKCKDNWWNLERSADSEYLHPQCEDNFNGDW